MIKETTGTPSTVVEFSFVANGKDYYVPSLQALRAICSILCGGYYEPKSDRDALLGAKLYDLLIEYGEDGISG